MKRPTVPVRVSILVAGLVFLSALPGVWARTTYGAQVSVDEPQYLMTALSLAHEFDLDVSDEIDEGSFRSFHEIGLNTQTTPVDAAGRRFSPHDPLLPLLLAPAMRLAPDGIVAGPEADDGVRGWVAARLTMAALAALTAAATALVTIKRLEVSWPVAVLVVVLGFSGVPLGPYATQVYPEMPAALATMSCVASLTSPRRLSLRHLAVAAIAIIALPWLAVKYVPVAAVLTGWLFVRLHRQGDRAPAAGLLGLLAAAGLIYAVVHQRIYGGWTVYASGDHFVESGELSVVGVSPDYLGRTRRLIGLLTDRSFGLIPWQPVWMLGPMAVAFHAKNDPRWRGAALTLLAGWGTATFVALTMHGWWSPGRQVVVVAPLALASIAALVDRVPRLAFPAVTLGFAGAVNWWWLALEATRGQRTIIVDFVETSAPPYRWVMHLFPDPLTNQREWLTLVWLAIIAASMLAGLRLRERTVPRPQ